LHRSVLISSAGEYQPKVASIPEVIINSVLPDIRVSLVFNPGLEEGISLVRRGGLIIYALHPEITVLGS
jgi:hypothetical protein